MSEIGPNLQLQRPEAFLHPALTLSADFLGVRRIMKSRMVRWPDAQSWVRESRAQEIPKPPNDDPRHRASEQTKARSIRSAAAGIGRRARSRNSGHGSVQRWGGPDVRFLGKARSSNSDGL